MNAEDKMKNLWKERTQREADEAEGLKDAIAPIQEVLDACLSWHNDDLKHPMTYSMDTSTPNSVVIIIDEKRWKVSFGSSAWYYIGDSSLHTGFRSTSLDEALNSIMDHIVNHYSPSVPVDGKGE